MRFIRIGLGLLLASAGEMYAQQYVISTVAGAAPPTPVAALNVSVGNVRDLATSAAGLYFSSDLHCVFKVDPDGILSRIAGTCRAGYSGDGGPATSAQLYNPVGVAADAVGNLYIADDGNARVRKVTPDGIITTVAGNGNRGYSGDGGPATSARLCGLYGFTLALDTRNNLYMADSCSNRIRRVSPDGIITTIAGDGIPGYSGDGGAATSARLYFPSGVVVDPAGNVSFLDSRNNRVRNVSPDGIITTIAGNGTAGYSGDGGPATSAQLSPSGVALDSAGNLYIAASGRYVRKVSLNGIITTIATVSGNLVERVAVSADGDLYVSGGCMIHRISAAGALTAVAGNGACSFSGDGGPVTTAQVDPTSVAADSAGNLFIAEAQNHRVRKVSSDGVIATVAGNGGYGYSGDGGAATGATVLSLTGVATDSAGNVYFAENTRDWPYGSHVRKVSPDGVITTVAGCFSCSDADEGPATSAYLNFVSGLAADPAGNLYVTDRIYDYEFVNLCRVYKIAPDGFLTTIVARAFAHADCGYAGDGGPAVSAQVSPSSAIAADTTGNLYIGEYARVRKVSAGGIITTVAGTGTSGSSGDGGPATSARVTPSALAVDSPGNLYIGDYYRVRKVTPDGIITTIAGNGFPGYDGDGGPATSAQLNRPAGLTVDAAGNVYVIDSANHAIRILRPVANQAVSMR